MHCRRDNWGTLAVSKSQQRWKGRRGLSPFCCCAILLLLNSAKTVTDSLAPLSQSIRTLSLAYVYFVILNILAGSVVMKFHGQSSRRKHIVSSVTAPLPGDVFIRRVGHFCRQYA